MAAEDRCRMSVMLTSSDMRASVRFYRDQLGFEMKESWPDPESPMWANLVLDGQSVMLGAAMDPGKVGEACQGDAAAERYWKEAAKRFREHPAGVGVQIYLTVPDVDAFAAEIRGRGVALDGEPKTQFYGIREIGVDDPDGYRLILFAPVAMESCQSCGMPLSDAAPGQMYCAHCTDEAGALRPYEEILEGTTTGYFMGVRNLERAEAEAAAREHLATMPAWAGRPKEPASR